MENILKGGVRIRISYLVLAIIMGLAVPYVHLAVKILLFVAATLLGAMENRRTSSRKLDVMSFYLIGVLVGYMVKLFID